MKAHTHRTEHDLVGDKQVPTSAYYGVHTLRAQENFSITQSSVQMYPHFINAIAYVKEACATTNKQLGQLDPKIADAIIKSCKNIRNGELHDNFIVDIIQGGAGTSMNMNANEVIANSALEILGHNKGDYNIIHPLDHVNMSQSTNDVFPTSIKVALRFEVDTLLSAADELHNEFSKKAKEFSNILKMGRTQLQEAVPMTLGQEFKSYADTLAGDKLRLEQTAAHLEETNMGATAIGTGINTRPEYADLVAKNLSKITGYKFKKANNLIKATQDMSGFTELSSTLKQMSIKISKICNDLRLLSSGPRAGIGEINLPAVQAGSSIMPGKVNPVIPEVVNQIAFEVIGNDTTVTFAAEAGQLQLNAFEPVIAYNLFNSMAYLKRGYTTLAHKCVSGITANNNKLEESVANSIGIVTALNPHIGYVNASSVAKEAAEKGTGVSEVVLSRGLLSQEQLNVILHPKNLTEIKKPVEK